MVLLKGALLKLIPYSAIYFFKKYANINFFLFGPALRQGTYIFEQSDAAIPDSKIPEDLPSVVKHGFSSTFQIYKGRHGFLRQFMLYQNECYVEPDKGWGISSETRKLVFDSIPYNAWREAYHPSYLRFVKEYKTASTLEEAVSINIIPGGEDNYWHFLHDLLGQVFMALEHLPDNTPILISSTLADKPYFKEALKLSPRLSSLNWKVRKNYFFVKKAWFLQVMPNSHTSLFRFKDTLIHREEIIPSRKIFLIRSPQRIRYIENTSELVPIAQKYGFEVVDTDLMSLPEQINLFSQTKILVGIHGAGLTNIVFGKKTEMSVLELLPNNYIQPHYCWLSADCGYRYTCLLGSNTGSNTAFSINLSLFEQKLSEILDI